VGRTIRKSAPVHQRFKSNKKKKKEEKLKEKRKK
jgi:hypothetical protein